MTRSLSLLVCFAVTAVLSAQDATDLPKPGQQGDAAKVKLQAPKPGIGKNSWFDASELDLGTFLEGEQASGKFKFRNPTDKDQKLLGVSPTCTCAKAVITVGGRRYEVRKDPTPNTIYRMNKGEGGVLTPERVKYIHVGKGESGEVDVTLDLRGINGKKEAGVTIQLTDETLRIVTLKCKATAAAYFNTLPQEVNLNKMTWSDSREFSVQISSPIKPDFEITGHEPLPAKMKVEYHKELNQGKATWFIKGTYGPNVDPDQGGGIIKFKTNVQNKVVQVRVIAWVEGPIELKPGGFMSLGMIRSGKGASRTVDFVPSGGFDLQLEKVVLKNLTVPEKFITITTRKEGKILKLELKISPDTPCRLIRGDIEVHLNHPAAKLRELQFNGWVRR